MAGIEDSESQRPDEGDDEQSGEQGGKQDALLETGGNVEGPLGRNDEPALLVAAIHFGKNEKENRSTY
jgi:hypothetical protein